MVFNKNKIVYMTLCMSTLLASYNTSNTFGLKRELKESSLEIWEIKRHALDASDLTEYFPELASEMDEDDSFINELIAKYIDGEIPPVDDLLGLVTDQSIDASDDEDISKELIMTELVVEKMEDEESLITDNPQSDNDILIYSKEKEGDLLNSQTEIANEEPQCVSDEIDTVSYAEQKLLQVFNDISVYSYSNSMFLNRFLYFPSSNFTADSIRVRFGSGFLNFLSTNQLIRVLVTLLNRNLKLTETERTELVGIIFGCIDFSLEMSFDNTQVVNIVTALLMSDVPFCFEQVFLTWKMWKVFTIMEQIQMLWGVVGKIDHENETKKKYEKETMVMLYLFILNKDVANSNACEVFKQHIIKIYGNSHILNNDKIRISSKYIREILLIGNKLDTSLLDLPKMLKNLNNTDLTKFKNSIRRCISIRTEEVYSTHFGKRYKIHICYILTKFTPENTQNNNEDDINIYDRIYFEPKYIKYALDKWSRSARNDSFSVNECDVNELRNAYGAMRQIVQSEQYNLAAFLKLFAQIEAHISSDNIFCLVLFSLTNENILRDVCKTPEWAEHIKDITMKRCEVTYVEHVFTYNSTLSLKLPNSFQPSDYVEYVTSALLNLVNKSKELYRERYLYQQLVFHPKFKIFNNYLMPSYILKLNKTGLLDDKEKCTQIARDLIFNEYYHKSAMRLKLELIGIEGNIEKFRTELTEECERYENKTSIENERDALKSC